MCVLCLPSDKSNKAISLGSFLTSPQILPGNDIRLVYSDGSLCSGKRTKIQTVLTLKCKPGGPRVGTGALLVLSVATPVSLVCPLVPLSGDLQSVPLLRSVSSDRCLYELEWHTAAACILSRAQGDDCKVEDAQAGESWPLRDAVERTPDETYLESSFGLQSCI